MLQININVTNQYKCYKNEEEEKEGDGVGEGKEKEEEEKEDDDEIIDDSSERTEE